MKIFYALTITIISTLSSLGAAEKPNILFILIDDLGWMDLACQGNTKMVTPNIDQLAKEGVRFTNGYAGSTVCSPSRAAAITGLYPARLKITQHGEDNWSFYVKSEWGSGKSTGILDPSIKTIAETLKETGYETSFIGKWHLSGDKFAGSEQYLPDNQGFDVNIAGNGKGGPGGVGSFFSPYKLPNLAPGPKGEYLPYRLADEAKKRLEYHAKSGKPFFMCLWEYTVHWPIEAPEELYKKYSKNEKPNNEERYQAMVEAMDIAIGKTLKALEELKLKENTIVVFTSDNGFLDGYTSGGSLRGSKGHLYEGGIRVPFIVRYPNKIKGNTVNSTPVISVDLAPTFAELAGVKFAEKEYDGESLVSLLTENKPLKRKEIFFHYPHLAFHKANKMGSIVRQENFKLIHNFTEDEYELYDLSSDVSEATNLVDVYPEKVAELKKKLSDWKSSVNAENPRLKKDIPAEEIEGIKK